MIDYKQSLNAAQYAATTAPDGAVLVIAGAGSGKTRTIVYRLAWLYEQGIDPSAMLLLTFTRKAAQEMLQRASQLLDHELMRVQGGTFHAFAYATLRQYKPTWLEGRHFSVLDSADITAALRHCKEELKLGKGDRSFPKTQTIVSLLSKARNKEIPLIDVLHREAQHLLPHADALTALQEAYTTYRKSQGVLDYDDLLFELEALLQEDRPEVRYLRQRFKYIMVDEYQDTNLVQARIVRLLASQEYGGHGNIMAVGDDAQSIYAFRGANVQNILDFPKFFPNTSIIRLEENYRSTQPVLDVANILLANAQQAYEKKLFTSREGGEPVRHIRPISDASQANLVVKRVQELLNNHLPHEIAILFRAGFHSYNVEVALNRAGIRFRKYGGLRFAEAAHVKDVLAYARLVLNPLDMSAFERVAMLHKGIGPKTMQKLYTVAIAGDAKATEKAFTKYPDFLEDMRFLDAQRVEAPLPGACIQHIIEHYQEKLETQYPDDWPRRRQGLDEVQTMAERHTELDLFIADLVLESPEEDEDREGCITLSTVHSAKGLEWNAVLIIDLVEERFPSRHALSDAESFEEERRLMYVACTRARLHLDLFAPSNVYSRGTGNLPASPSPFVRELPQHLCQEWIERYEGYLQSRNESHSTGTQYTKKTRLLPTPDPNMRHERAGHAHTSFAHQTSFGKDISATNTASAMAESTSVESPLPLGYCHHKIFGRGKMIKFLPPDKYQVNFSGFGLKVILKDFLTPEN